MGREGKADSIYYTALAEANGYYHGINGHRKDLFL